ncbi:MAG: hypothetical protein WCC60_13605, partial [Ilumatobacteraceae bacterium]
FHRSLWAPVSWRAATATATVLVGLTAVLVSPGAALVALLPAAAIVASRRPAIAGVSALLLAAGIGARITQRQLIERHLANAAWPGFWEKLHAPGLLVVTLLTAAALFDRSGDAQR